ncbi:hypothetical protein [Treponema sp.]|uniref:hypothetical protein n=1 Tax=Treponema sp. TaxID=166 RepID=UPI00257C076F|nr:hypothetical protein [Treponema sp.]MBE6354862.1 hypothetical protein [Treponema sp.]
MRNKNWIKHVGTLLLLVCFGFLAAGSMEDDSSKTSSKQSSKTSSKHYSDFSEYYLTTTHEIALGDVASGTPVWFLGRGNYGNDALLSVWDSESDYRLQKADIKNGSAFAEAFKTQPASYREYLKIFGYVDNRKLYILRVEHSGHSWTK